MNYKNHKIEFKRDELPLRSWKGKGVGYGWEIYIDDQLYTTVYTSVKPYEIAFERIDTL